MVVVRVQLGGGHLVEQGCAGVQRAHLPHHLRRVLGRQVADVDIHAARGRGRRSRPCLPRSGPGSPRARRTARSAPRRRADRRCGDTGRSPSGSAFSPIQGVEPCAARPTTSNRSHERTLGLDADLQVGRLPADGELAEVAGVGQASGGLGVQPTRRRTPRRGRSGASPACPRAGPGGGEIGQRGQHRGERALHVVRAAAVQVAVGGAGGRTGLWWPGTTRRASSGSASAGPKPTAATTAERPLTSTTRWPMACPSSQPSRNPTAPRIPSSVEVS